jgi:hypothetical protein
MPSRVYPATVAEVLSDNATFNPNALRAVRAFRRSKPWRGTVDERIAKFRTLNAALAAAYGIPEPDLRPCLIDSGVAGNGMYSPSNHLIVLAGKLSVVTFLHEFGHARGFGERGACRWSINLFRRMFPRSFARCEFRGHMVISRPQADGRVA